MGLLRSSNTAHLAKRVPTRTPRGIPNKNGPPVNTGTDVNGGIPFQLSRVKHLRHSTPLFLLRQLPVDARAMHSKLPCRLGDVAARLVQCPLDERVFRRREIER